MRRTGFISHVAQNNGRSRSFSIVSRRGLEMISRWLNLFGGLRQFKLRGQESVSGVFCLHVIAYNLIRLGNLLNSAIEAA